jgi:hypothetical protein
MKKLILVLFIMVFALYGASFAALEDKNVQTGLLFLDLPGISMVHHNAAKQITGFTGINVGLGISHRAFFEPLKTNAWNMHWDIGTIVLVLPYVGIGTDYVWDNGWYVGIGTFYIIPEIHAGVYF